MVACFVNFDSAASLVFTVVVFKFRNQKQEVIVGKYFQLRKWKIVLLSKLERQSPSPRKSLKPACLNLQSIVIIGS